MNHKLITVLLVAAAILMVSSCHRTPAKRESTIDWELNHFTDSLLVRMMEKQQADSGLIMVVGTSTGYIKAASSMFCGCESRLRDFHIREYSSLGGQIATCLAALEAGTLCLSDTVDVDRGFYVVDSITKVRDSNFRTGGYGKLTFHDAFVKRSNVATYLAASKAFGDSIGLLREAYDRMGYKIDNAEEMSFANASIGYAYKIGASDILEFVNGIANGGKMVDLTFGVGDVYAYKQQMARVENLRAVRDILEDGNGALHKKLQQKVPVGVMGGITQLMDSVAGNYCKIELCGYFPASDPQYTVYIGLYKHGVVAQTVLLAEPFGRLVEYLYPKKSEKMSCE